MKKQKYIKAVPKEPVEEYSLKKQQQLEVLRLMEPEVLRVEVLENKSSARLLFENLASLLTKLESIDQRIAILSICMLHSDLAEYFFEQIDVSTYLNYKLLDISVDDNELTTTEEIHSDEEDVNSGEHDGSEDEETEDEVIKVKRDVKAIKRKSAKYIINKIIFHHPPETNLMGKALYACFKSYEHSEFYKIFKHVFLAGEKQGFKHADQLAAFVLSATHISLVERKKFIATCEKSAEILYRSKKGYFCDDLCRRRWKGVTLAKKNLDKLVGSDELKDDNLEIANSIDPNNRLPIGLWVRIGHEVSSVQVVNHQGNGKKNGRNKRTNGVKKTNFPSELLFEAHPQIKSLMSYELVWRQLFKKEHPDSELKSITFSNYYAKMTIVRQILSQLKSGVTKQKVKFDREELVRQSTAILKQLYNEGDLDAAILFAQLGASILVKTKTCVRTVHQEWQLGLNYLGEVYSQTSRKIHCGQLISRLGFLNCKINLDLLNDGDNNSLLELGITHELTPKLGEDQKPAANKKQPNGVTGRVAESEASGDESDDITITEELSSTLIASIN